MMQMRGYGWRWPGKRRASLGEMKKPNIIAVDDDLSVLRAVERDLKGRFSSHYRVLAADSA